MEKMFRHSGKSHQFTGIGPCQQTSKGRLCTNTTKGILTKITAVHVVSGGDSWNRLSLACGQSLCLLWPKWIQVRSTCTKWSVKTPTFSMALRPKKKRNSSFKLDLSLWDWTCLIWLSLCRMTMRATRPKPSKARTSPRPSFQKIDKKNSPTNGLGSRR